MHEMAKFIYFPKLKAPAQLKKVRKSEKLFKTDFTWSLLFLVPTLWSHLVPKFVFTLDNAYLCVRIQKIRSTNLMQKHKSLYSFCSSNFNAWDAKIQVEMLNFWNAINCVFVNWMKKLTLVFSAISPKPGSRLGVSTLPWLGVISLSKLFVSKSFWLWDST